MIEVPTVTAYEDYEFKGWQVDGDQTTTYSHDELVQLFASGEAANLAYYGDSTEGYMTITALFDEKEPVVEEKRTSVVNFNVDSSMGSFENTTDTTVTKTVEEGTIITFPKVVAKEGYVFVGWKGEGAESINWGADVYSADTTGLCYFYGDDTTGYASVNAVFEEAPAEDEYTIINVVFKSTGGKNLGGGDFVVDADGDGVANYNELPLPEGYELTETGDFFVKDGNSYVITLKKIVEGTIINVQFVDSTTGEVVARRRLLRR